MWARKWTTADRSVRSTKAGQCVTTMTTLNVTIAGTNRDIERTVRNSQRGESIQRASQAGVPSRSSGAASIV